MSSLHIAIRVVFRNKIGDFFYIPLIYSLKILNHHFIIVKDLTALLRSN